MLGKLLRWILCGKSKSSGLTVRIDYIDYRCIRYIFPPEPDETGALDLTKDDTSFYLNPYSGELSIEFPKVNRSCRGGILA